MVFITVGRINQYAAGVAVVRVEDRTDVTATTSATVSAIEVAPGQTVAAGTLLVRLYEAHEAAELERTRREFELSLLGRLRNPTDAAVERSLGALRSQLQPPFDPCRDAHAARDPGLPLTPTNHWWSRASATKAWVRPRRAACWDGWLAEAASRERVACRGFVPPCVRLAQLIRPGVHKPTGFVKSFYSTSPLYSPAVPHVRG